MEKKAKRLIGANITKEPDRETLQLSWMSRTDWKDDKT